MTTWHRIDDPEHPAPLNTPILVFGEAYDGGTAYGVAVAKKVTDEWWEHTAKDTKKLHTEIRIEYTGAELFPTHWQPLPEPPRP